MRTRRNWRNQDRLYKAIGQDLTRAADASNRPATFPTPMTFSCCECDTGIASLNHMAALLQAVEHRKNTGHCVRVMADGCESIHLGVVQCATK